MARWSVVTGAMSASKVISLAPANLNPVALISTLVFFSVCITMLLALCAAHSSHHHHRPPVLNARRDDSSEPDLECTLAIAPPEQFVKSKDDPHPEELSFRFSPGFSSGNVGTINSRVAPKLSSAGAVINKLGSSFRIRSFRESSAAASPRGSASFRILTSFRMDTCKQGDVVDALRRAREHAPGLEPEEDHSSQATAEPAVWQRVILRGERCAPLSFSGLILYDENGNLLPPSFAEEETTRQSVTGEDHHQQRQQQASIHSFGRRVRV